MRVAYANVRGGVLCLGDPGGRHVRLLADGIQAISGQGDDDAERSADRDDDAHEDADAYGADRDDGYDYDERSDDGYDLDAADSPGDGRAHDGVPRGLVRWGDLAALEIDAPTTRWRYPGVLSTVVAAVVGNIGIEWYPEGAAFDVEITTASGVGIVACDGFAGRGYWAPHARAVEALLRLLVSERAPRAWLDTPGDLLGVVASVARSGPTDEALADELRVLLEAGPRRV
ncbi:hypothetical protein [Sanguibacter inulinus]|uniref:Uncharacterized protein n=1 Tax=Sanguibacter inulinus TaxID=60922 RepID=A0A853EU11_9MICO|nr:hypothetical protein [Sanguibacter inulinus]MBF0722940.1 hypothetical protein [Sanguibacter inulinus]NYS94085.1 hypothetical protein [Sanguibacter inulinus]